MDKLVENKIKRIKRAYNTSDIVNAVAQCLKESWAQAVEFSQQFKRATDLETCQAINDYVVNNITYKEDGTRFQYVKTPARLVADGFGDCKSMAVFCASCLCCLGIKNSLRFVAFSGNRVGHVYVVTASGINVDPVECLQNNKPFGEVSPYTYKIDMQNNYGLAILSGVGSSEPYKAFLGSSNFLDNTLATNYLYSCMDLQLSILDAEPNNVEAMNQADIIMASFVLNNAASGHTKLQERAANILQYLADNGYFTSNSINDAIREKNIITTQSLALDLLAADSVLEYPGMWYDWYMYSVAKYDYNNVSAGTRQLITEYAKKNAVGTVDKNKLANDIKESGVAGLYMFCSETFINNLAKKQVLFKTKRAMQVNAYNTMADSLTDFFTPETTYNYALSGCIAKLGTTPEKAIKGAIAEKNSVGSVLGVLLIVLQAIAVAVATFQGILYICQQVKSSKAAKIEKSINDYANNSAAAAGSDLDGLTWSDTTNTTTTNTASLWLLGTVAALFFVPKLIKKNKK